MRRAALVVTCLAACGRFEFGVLPAPDADEPIPCMVDGTACEDLDICTTMSTCVSGVCVGPTLPVCTVASSADEYSSTQGQNGWFYGAWSLDDDNDAVYEPGTDFESFVFYAPDETWRPASFEIGGPGFTWALLSRGGGHSAMLPKPRYPALRWVSDVVGHATIIVRASKIDVTGGDGVAVLVYTDGTLLLERVVAYDDAVGFTETVSVDLVVGTRIDTLVAYGGDEFFDSVNLEIKVESR